MDLHTKGTENVMNNLAFRWFLCNHFWRVAIMVLCFSLCLEEWLEGYRVNLDINGNAFFFFCFTLYFASFVKSHLCLCLWVLSWKEKKKSWVATGKKKLEKQVQTGLNKITLGPVSGFLGMCDVHFSCTQLTSLSNDEGSGMIQAFVKQSQFVLRSKWRERFL